MDCIFCKIANKELESKIIYEDEVVVAFLDVNPTSNGHTLIVPKKHYTDYIELDKDTLNHMFQVAKELGPKIMQKMGAKSLTLLFNYGDDQKVKHVHLHLIPDFIESRHNPNLRSIEENFSLLKD